MKTDEFKIAVSGTGCMSALGPDLETCMDQMFEGRRNLAPPTRFLSSHEIPYPVFELPASFPLTKDDQDSEDLTRTAAMAVAAAWQALENAGILPLDLAGKKVGVCMGTTVGCALNNDQFYQDFREEKQPGMAPIKRYLRSNPAAAVAKRFGLNGPVQTIVNACASGTDAIGVGASWIRSGFCDLVIAGGTDELCKTTYNGFISLRITDADPCRPFDATRAGLNLGEGAACVILEAEGPERISEKEPVCFLAGYGSACDAHHLTAPHPEGRGLERAMKAALSEHNLQPEHIGFINAHGTGTPENDKVEQAVLDRTFPGVPFFSTKGYTGHTLGAAGAIEAAFTIQHLTMGKLPQSIGFSKGIDGALYKPVTEAISIDACMAMSQSVAFGGNNSVLIFSKDNRF